MTASDHLKHRTGSLGGDQIPEDLKYEYELSQDYAAKQLPGWSASERICNLIERTGKAEAALAQKTRELLDKQQLYTEAVLRNDALEAQVEQLGRQVAELTNAVDLLDKYAPFSGDMALMIRASQPGGNEAHERANKLIEFYSHLDEAHDAASRARTK